jgi:hypothetical protein
MVLELRDDFHEFKESFRREHRKISQRIVEEWIDGQRVIEILKISKRTLQTLRDDGDLDYSSVKGKFYYKAGDLEEMLERNYKRRNLKI